MGQILTAAGIPQGLPLPYMYYNADLLDLPRHQEMSLGFIDDIAHGVQSCTDKENVRKLKPTLEEAEEWRKKHRAHSLATADKQIAEYTSNFHQIGSLGKA